MLLHAFVYATAGQVRINLSHRIRAEKSLLAQIGEPGIGKAFQLGLKLWSDVSALPGGVI